MQIRSFSAPYFPVFSPNTGKSGPEKTPHLDTFQVVTIADDLGLYVCQSIALPISLKNMNFTPHWCYVTYSTFKWSVWNCSRFFELLKGWERTKKSIFKWEPNFKTDLNIFFLGEALHFEWGYKN